MSSYDFTAAFNGKTGDSFIESMRALAIIARADGKRLMCGICGKQPASYIGMQACGTPAGPVCQDCLDFQRHWIETSLMIADAQPYCRHCNCDVDRTHVYAVDLYNASTERITL